MPFKCAVSFAVTVASSNTAYRMVIVIFIALNVVIILATSANFDLDSCYFFVEKCF